MANSAKDEIDQLEGTNVEYSTPIIGKRIVRALESIDKHLVELNESLLSIVGECKDPSSPGKTRTALLTLDVRQS